MAVYSSVITNNNSPDSVYENSWFLHFRYWLIRACSCPLFSNARIIPWIGGKTLPELLVCALFYGACIAIGVSANDLTSGVIAEVLGLIMMLFIMRSNVLLSSILGMSFERAIFWHKATAYLLIVMSIIHGIQEGSSGSGTILVLFFLLAAIVYLFASFKGYWNWFYYPHIMIYLVIVIVAAVHGAAILTASIIVWGIDLAIRFFISSKRIPCELIPIGTNVIKISFPKSFTYYSGQYAFLMVNDISSIEYHPFSFASAAHEDKVTIYIKVLGDWTQKLYELSKTINNETPCNICIEGGYGISTINVFDPSVYKVIVLVSGGIGVTPNLGLLKALAHLRKEKKSFTKIIFLWMMKEIDVADYICKHEIEPLLSELDIETKQLPEEQYLDFRLHLSSASASQMNLMTTNMNWKPGRPDLKAILREAGEYSEKVACNRVGVMVSGPGNLIQETRILCDQSLCLVGCSSVRFDCHEEVFSF